MTDNYSLLVKFPDDSTSFVNGFEAGMIWQEMRSSTPEIEKTVHTENKEVLERMAVAEGYEIEFENTEVEGWLFLTMRKTKPRLSGGNPNGLKVVR